MSIMKFGEHSYLPNGHQILIPTNWSKMKLRHAISLSFGLKGVKIVRASRIWCACLSIKWASKSMIKFQFQKTIHK